MYKDAEAEEHKIGLSRKGHFRPFFFSPEKWPIFRAFSPFNNAHHVSHPRATEEITQSAYPPTTTTTKQT